MDNNKFMVIIDNNKYDAYVISNFSALGNYYCAYAVDMGKDNKDIYCDKVVNNKLVKIEDDDEIKITNKIINSIISVIKENGGNING